MKLFFSPSTLSVYPSDIHADYEAAGTLPDDLLEITKTEYQTYFLMPTPAGQQLGADKMGKPCFITVAIDIEMLRTNFIKQIDNESATVTTKWTRFAEEYKEREAAALEYKEAGYTGDVSIYITSFADPAGMAYQAATDLILKQADDLRTLQSQLAAERMRKYELKATGLTLEEITVLRNEIVANIKALGDSYE